MRSPRPCDVLAAWLAEHLNAVERTIVIDDLQNAASDLGIAALIAGVVKRTGARVRWVFASHTMADFPLALWLAHGEATVPIDERVLRLTVDEARSLARSIAPEIDTRLVVRLCEATNGVPSVFAFALRTLAQDPHEAGRMLDAGSTAFRAFAELVFDRFTPIERTQLVDSAMLPDLDEHLVTQLNLDDRAPQLVRFQGGRLHLHGLFRDWLRERLTAGGSVAVRAAEVRAAGSLESAGRIDEALAMYVHARHHEGLTRLIEAHGLEYLEQGRGEAIREAADALDPLARWSAAILAIKAASESRSGNFAAAEALFQLALDRSPESRRSQISYDYGTHLLRFSAPEAVDVFEQLADDIDASGRSRAYALAGLGAAYALAGRSHDARRVANESLVLAIDIREPHVFAFSHFQASIVALSSGDAERAKRLASAALSLANECGFFEIASGALGVLLDVASNVEDDPGECALLLEALADCAAKTGSLPDRLTALVALLEVEVERNNERVVTRLDRKLHMLDVDSADSVTCEALAPARAMRASWTANFIEAHRLLQGSASRQPSPERKVLRLAEIAAYAAAAGLESEASVAIRAAVDLLARIPRVDLRVQRARMMLALAAIVLGRGESAAEILEYVEESSRMLPRRLLALYHALCALLARYRGAHDHDRLMARLVELDDAGFAGLARTLSNLPLRSADADLAALLTRTERAVFLRWVDKTGAIYIAPSAVLASEAGLATNANAG